LSLANAIEEENVQEEVVELVAVVVDGKLLVIYVKRDINHKAVHKKK